MSDPDMTGVDPLRWPEIRKRIAVLEAFAAIQDPTWKDKRRHAATMGLGAEQFRRLFLIWSGGAKPHELDGAGKHRSISKPKRDGLPSDTRTTVAEAIAAIGSTARPKDVTAEVLRRCAEARLRPPSRSQIWNMLMAARREEAPSGGGDVSAAERVVVGPVWFKIPVARGTVQGTAGTAAGAVLPEALVAVDGRGSILAAAVAVLPRRPTIATLLRKLAPDLRAAARTASARAARTGVAAPALASDLKLSRELPMLLGDRVGGVGVYHQPGRGVRPDRLAKGTRDSALAEPDALRAIAQAIERHNAVRAGGSAKPTAEP